VLEVAQEVGKALNIEIPPLITGQYRVGDIRHCFADIDLARRELGYEPQVEFQDGLRELANWLEVQTAVDRAVEARAELEQRGLTL
jgi:dTDP-L-rhamnose 4-epimerase